MTEYLTEQEQIEQLKKWLTIYGIPAIVGILVGLMIFYGWNYYQSYRMRILTHASGVYDEMLTDRAQSNKEGTIVQAQKLFSHYPSTPYGEMAAFMTAREAVVKKDYPEAIKNYSWVLQHSDQAAMRQIAKLRIARVYLAEQHPDMALQILDKVEDASFQGMIHEVQGDVYLAMNRNSDAEDAYKKALQELPHAEDIRPLLEMKLHNVTSG